jgi:hypothetical protein
MLGHVYTSSRTLITKHTIFSPTFPPATTYFITQTTSSHSRIGSDDGRTSSIILPKPTKIFCWGKWRITQFLKIQANSGHGFSSTLDTPLKRAFNKKYGCEFFFNRFYGIIAIKPFLEVGRRG